MNLLAFLKPKRLRTRTLVFVGVPVLGAVALIEALFVSQLYSRALTQALSLIEYDTTAVAERIEAWNLETVTVAGMMAGAQRNGMFGDRRASLAYARETLARYPQFTASYFGYEPNSDGRDAASRGTATGDAAGATDATGRFLPYWFRDREDPNKISLTPLIDMDTSLYYRGSQNRMADRPETDGITLEGGFSRYFDLSRSTLANAGEAMITEPYLYEGKLIIEQSYPIMLDGRFAGIAGVDRSLDTIEAFVSKQRPFATAEFLLISNRGRVITATMDRSLRTRPIDNLPFVAAIAPLYTAAGVTAPHEVVDATNGEAYYYTAAKIPTGNWTLVLRVRKSELLAPVWSTLATLLWVTGAALAAAALILVVVSGSIARPVRLAAAAATRVASGDLTAAPQETDEGETGALLEALRSMVQNLNQLIRRVTDSGDRVGRSVAQIDAAAGQQQATVATLGATANESVAAAKQISATAAELAGTMRGVEAALAGTATLADEGRQQLDVMRRSMNELQSGARDVTSTFTLIQQSAESARQVVTTITLVADRTNLLSLNAAIEARKAGEHGQGFAVVAREIRRLADETAVGTLDIERLILAMQQSVGSGTRAMDRFDGQVRASVERVSTVSDQLSRIIGELQQLLPRFSAISAGMQSQAAGSAQITSAMADLASVAGVTTQSGQDLLEVAKRLHEAVGSLRAAIEGFTITNP